MDYDAKDLKSVLLYMRGNFGAGVFEDAPRMFSILRDLAPGLKRDGNVLRQMSDAGLLRELRTVSETGGEHDRQRVVMKSRLWLGDDYLTLANERVDYVMTALQTLYGLETETPPPVAPPPVTPEPTPKPEPQKSTVTIVDSGRTGDCAWTLDSNGVLTISGHGGMNNYSFQNPPPWTQWCVRSVIIQDGVTQIGSSAFFHCRNLTNVNIPDSVTHIGGWAFNDCANLTSVTIPDSVTQIEDYAFGGCASLTSVIVPRRAKISKKAFDPHTRIERR